MTNRKHLVDGKNLPDLSSTTHAAMLLGVTPQTIRNACKRLKVGSVIAMAGNRKTVVLSQDDLLLLDAKLQNGSGNLTRSNL